METRNEITGRQTLGRPLRPQDQREPRGCILEGAEGDRQGARDDLIRARRGDRCGTAARKPVVGRPPVRARPLSPTSDRRAGGAREAAWRSCLAPRLPCGFRQGARLSGAAGCPRPWERTPENPRPLARDDLSSKRHPAPAPWWSMIISENRYPLPGSKRGAIATLAEFSHRVTLWDGLPDRIAAAP